jgi:hypothetical protein
VVLVKARESHEDRERRGIEVGFNAYIAKRVRHVDAAGRRAVRVLIVEDS